MSDRPILPRLSNWLRCGVCLAALLAASACEVGPDYKRPAVDVPAAFGESGDWERAQPHDTIDRGAWWSVYNEPLLNALENQIEISNQNLKAAEASYEQAEAIVDQTRASLFPSLDLEASAIKSGTGQGSSSSSASRGPATLTTYSIGPTATWAPDVWGRIRRGIESDEANAQASAADLASARLSAQAAVATDYFDLRLQDELKRLLRRNVEDDSKILTIVQNQYTAGIAAKADVLSAKTQLESVQAAEINADVRRTQLEHALAVLVGKAPANFMLAPETFNARVPNLPGEVPSVLLERRPDIALAERQMISANAQVGIADAAYYPNFTISASYGLTGTVLAKLFQASNSLWTVGPAVAETIFDAGAREAVVEQAEAGYRQNVANYRQTVLTAFQQVEDELAAQRILGDQAAAEDQTVADARKAEELTLNQYKEGIVPYNNVLTAQITTLSNEETALSVSASRFEASVALIQALGGGWDADQLINPILPQNPPANPEYTF